MELIGGEFTFFRAIRCLALDLVVVVTITLTACATPEDALINDSAIRWYSVYKGMSDSESSKVFVQADNGAWSYQADVDIDVAVEKATDRCLHRSMIHDTAPIASCRFFAIGNTIVWDMAKVDVDEVLRLYRQRHELDSYAPIILEASVQGIALEKPYGAPAVSIYDAASRHCSKYGKTSETINSAFPRYFFRCQ